MVKAESSETRDTNNKDPRIGAVIGGKYRIERVIGRGGMGIVYLARQDAAPREVVVKMLAPEALARPGAVARFEREARSLQALRHSNIVEMFDFGRDDDHSYLVMEYLVGEPLEQYVARRGALSLEDFVPIAAQILKGVGFAHSRDLVIRDIKPAHVMLCERGRRANFVKLLDFGLAKLLHEDNPITTEFALGTVGFIAPEVVAGAPSSLRVDVFALGVLFYFMLSGHMPKYVGSGDGPFETVEPLTGTLPPGNELPDAVTAMVHKCLERDPGARPADANQIVEMLIDAVPAPLFRLPLARREAGQEKPSTTPNTGVIDFEEARPKADSEGSGERRIPPTAPVGAYELDSPITAEVYNRGRRGALVAGLLVGAAVAAGAVWFWGSRSSSTTEPPTSADGGQVAVAESAESPEGAKAAESAPPMPTSNPIAPPEADVVAEGGEQTENDAKHVAWSLVVRPEGAHITVDGKRVGDAPYEGSLTVGKHSVTVEADGYEAWGDEVEIGEGDNEPMVVELTETRQPQRSRYGRRAGRSTRPRSASEEPTPTENKPTPATPAADPPEKKSSVLLSGSKKKSGVLLRGDSD